MIRTKSSNDNWIRGVTVISAFLLLCVLGFMLVVPAPSLERASITHDQALRKQAGEMAKALADTKEVQSKMAQNVWMSSLETVAPSMLAKLNKLALTDKVKLSSFRPQRTTNLDGLTQVPYVLTVDGSFPNIVAFVRDIETPRTKIAVIQSQMNAVDGSTDKVSATIGVVAYMLATGESNG